MNRKKGIIILSVVAALAAAVFCLSRGEQELDNPPVVIEINENSIGVLDMKNTTIEDTFEYADLVVRGKYRGVVKGVPIIFDGKPLQFQELEVEKVYKGKCGDSLVYANLGGEVNLREYVKSAKREGILGQKVGPPLSVLDYFQEKYPGLNVLYRCDDDFPFVPDYDQEYLVFLKWASFGNFSGAYLPSGCLWGKKYTTGFRKISQSSTIDQGDLNFETERFLWAHDESKKEAPPCFPAE